MGKAKRERERRWEAYRLFGASKRYMNGYIRGYYEARMKISIIMTRNQGLYPNLVLEDFPGITVEQLEEFEADPLGFLAGNMELLEAQEDYAEILECARESYKKFLEEEFEKK